MLKQLQHKRFTTLSAGVQMWSDISSPGCHWYVQANRSIEPAGSYNDDIHKRPCYIHA